MNSVQEARRDQLIRHRYVSSHITGGYSNLNGLGTGRMNGGR